MFQKENKMPNSASNMLAKNTSCRQGIVLCGLNVAGAGGSAGG